MIRVKRERQKQRNFLSHWCHKPLCIFYKNMGMCSWLFCKEIWKDWGFCLLPKIPTLAKENSRAWAWALQKNIMGLNFKTYPTIPPHVLKFWFFFFFFKLGNHKMKLVLMSCGLESTLGICILEFTKSWWYMILNQFHEPQEYEHLCLWILGRVLDLSHFSHAPHLDFHECSREFALTLIGGGPTSTPT